MEMSFQVVRIAPTYNATCSTYELYVSVFMKIKYGEMDRVCGMHGGEMKYRNKETS
jgi:hypothetical protein